MQTTARPFVELSHFDSTLLASLYRHRLFSTTQIHQLHGQQFQRRWVQRQLKRLEAKQYITKVTGRPPSREARWFCTSLGAQIAEESGNVTTRPFRMDTHRAISGASHLLKVNDIGIILAKTANQSGDDFNYNSWEHEIAHRYGPEKSDMLIADALVTYDTTTKDAVTAERRFIELDRGTMPVHTLVDKIVAYNRYRTWEPRKVDSLSHLPRLAWRRNYAAFPNVVFVFAGLNIEAAKRRTNKLAGFLATDPRLTSNKVQAVATTITALNNNGPFAPICIDLTTQKPAPLFA